MLHHAGQALQGLSQGWRVENLSEVAVEDGVALVRNERGAIMPQAQNWICSQPFQLFPDRTSGKWNDFNRQRKTAQPLNYLVFVRHDDQAVRSGRDDLFVE